MPCGIRYLHLAMQQRLIVVYCALQCVGVACRIFRIVRLSLEIVWLEIPDVAFAYFIDTGTFRCCVVVDMPDTRSHPSPVVRQAEDIACLMVKKIFAVRFRAFLVLIFPAFFHLAENPLVLHLVGQQHIHQFLGIGNRKNRCHVF